MCWDLRILLPFSLLCYWYLFYLSRKTPVSALVYPLSQLVKEMVEFHEIATQDGIERVNKAFMEGFFEAPEIQPTDEDLNIEEVSDIQTCEKVLSRQVSTYTPPELKPSSIYKKSTYTPNKLKIFLSKSTFKSIVIPHMSIVEITLEYDPAQTY